MKGPHTVLLAPSARNVHHKCTYRDRKKTGDCLGLKNDSWKVWHLSLGWWKYLKVNGGDGCTVLWYVKTWWTVCFKSHMYVNGILTLLPWGQWAHVELLAYNPKHSSNSLGICWSAQHLGIEFLDLFQKGRLDSKDSPPEVSLKEGEGSNVLRNHFWDILIWSEN